jgi:hypothetical protein
MGEEGKREEEKNTRYMLTQQHSNILVAGDILHPSDTHTSTYKHITHHQTA